MPRTNAAVPSPENPSTLPSRFAIRKLVPEHSPWAAAILLHSNLFHSPVWPILYPENLTARLHQGMSSVSYLVDHQIDSGLSYGVFDTAYTLKRSESAKTGGGGRGALYWDASEAGVQESQGRDKEGERLLAQMDFPLVSVVLSYDSVHPLDMDKMGPLMATLPHFGLFYHCLDEADRRDPASWKARAPNEVLFRNATSTRHDYEEHHLMSGTARWLMREAALKGFRGIQIECLHDKVTRVWSNPEEPFKGTIVSQVDMSSKVDDEGKKIFEPATQVGSKVYVDLKPGE
ncbi:hypothetical protein K504DRAFT_486404 [Pleomassaria siparia CBS 279.74]|uniref:Uncharacterized protein n=1 Tax=Pleomassaria siparia CBS 279.74 TaxID=1314801 RepID=A0A6G1KPV7_9PLEO|nr:hypothetical protein K504DRAFT_486404 [Pleomassaria siparia CBS 279.74]